MTWRLLLTVVLISTALSGLTWKGCNAWERHNLQHLVIDADREALRAVWLDCVKRGACEAK